MNPNRQTSDIHDLIKLLALLHRSNYNFRDIQHAAAALGSRTAGPEHSAWGYDAKRVTGTQAFRSGLELDARQDVALTNDHGLALMRRSQERLSRLW